MKRKCAIAFVLAFALRMGAQEFPNAPSFWTKEQKITTSANFALGAWDSAKTCQNLAGGGHEYWNPSQSCGVNAGMIMGGKVGLLGVQYLLWKHGHQKIARAIGWAGIGGSSSAITYSYVKK